MKHFTDLEAWNVGMDLATTVYRLTSSFPKEERFGLTDQLRRSSTSVLANLAEGIGRYSWADRANKFTIARGEASEVEALVHIAVALSFLKKEDGGKLVHLAKHEGALLSGLITFCRKRSPITNNK